MQDETLAIIVGCVHFYVEKKKTVNEINLTSSVSEEYFCYVCGASYRSYFNYCVYLA